MIFQLYICRDIVSNSPFSNTRNWLANHGSLRKRSTIIFKNASGAASLHLCPIAYNCVTPSAPISSFGPLIAIVHFTSILSTSPLHARYNMAPGVSIDWIRYQLLVGRVIVDEYFPVALVSTGLLLGGKCVFHQSLFTMCWLVRCLQRSYPLFTIHRTSYAHTLHRTGRFTSCRASYIWVTGFYARVTSTIELTLIDTAARGSDENPIHWP